MRRIGLALLGIVMASLTARVIAAGYDQMRREAIGRCQAINASDHQTGLAFNPDGYRSYYVRSECFQRVAVQFRDESLCRDVRQRQSLLWSSWGYSPSRCRELVTEALGGDRKTLEDMKKRYADGGMKLRDFHIARNGNGRDYDIVPSFTGHYAHGYQLTFEILDASSPQPILLYSTGSYVDATSNLNFYVRQNELRQRFPALTLNRTYAVRASVTLDVGNGGVDAHWSPQFVDAVFPARERTHSLTTQATF